VGICLGLQASVGICWDLPIFVGICRDLQGSVWLHTLRHSAIWLWGPVSSPVLQPLTPGKILSRTGRTTIHSPSWSYPQDGRTAPLRTLVLVCGNYQRCKSKPVLLCEGAKSPHIRVVSSALAVPVLSIQALLHATKPNWILYCLHCTTSNLEWKKSPRPLPFFKKITIASGKFIMVECSTFLLCYLFLLVY